MGTGDEVVFPNEWPEEAREAIRQLGLEEMVASGGLILRWGEEEFFSILAEELGIEAGAWAPFPNIIVRKYPTRRSMVWAVVHELVHAWMMLESNLSCNSNPTDEAWLKSEEGNAWISALREDLREIGPIPGFDDRIYNQTSSYGDKLTSELPRHSLAEFYPYWYMGFRGTQEELEELYRLAPNRCQYLEDRFGPPPPRQ